MRQHRSLRRLNSSGTIRGERHQPLGLRLTAEGWRLRGCNRRNHQQHAGYARLVTLGAPGLVIVVVIVAVVIVAVLVASGPLTARSKQSDTASKTITLPERGDVWLGRVATSLSGLSGHRVEWPSATTLELYWTRRPVWTFIVAVFLFPFGLLALLVTTTLVGTFHVIGSGPPANIRVAGDFSRVAVDVVNRAIPD